MRSGRQFHGDPVAGADRTACEDDRHDTGLADEIAVGVAIEHGRPESLLEFIQLPAGVAQPRDLDDRLIAEREPRAARQGQQVDPAGRDVLPHLTGGDREAGPPELIVQLGVDQMDLPEIRLRGIAGDA